jgi:(p)ppGpp synthase/HD superfamily hydrolase
MWSQELYLRALAFAARAHEGQRVPGSGLAYIVHPVSVAMEVMATVAAGEPLRGDLVVPCALLHDTIEDTPVTYEDLTEAFSAEVADGVQALSKDRRLAPLNQLRDSIDRIERQPREIWAVKLADRITNLQQPPPDWTVEKVGRYSEDARMILSRLGAASERLARRLRRKIDEYDNRAFGVGDGD